MISFPWLPDLPEGPRALQWYEAIYIAIASVSGWAGMQDCFELAQLAQPRT